MRLENPVPCGLRREEGICCVTRLGHSPSYCPAARALHLPSSRPQRGPRRNESEVPQLKADETVVFAYIVYKSRKHRDLVNTKVMKDPRIMAMGNAKDMPFDGKRMFWGGFKALVEL